MAVEQDERPSFYQGQYLGPDDLTAAVDYGRIQLGRHILGAHTCGIAIGLQLIEKPSPAGNNQVDVFLEPGYAWDGFGRAIVVLSPYKIPVSLFQNITYDASIDDPTKSGDSAAGHPVKIWLQYSESATQPAASGFEVCDVSDQTSRIQETFELLIGEFTNASDQRDPLSIAGQSVDALQALTTFDSTAPQIYDLSIPEQALPEDNSQALWLIPVGYVRWLPPQTSIQTGSFQQRTGNDLTRSNAARQPIGVVAGAVEAVDQNVRVKLRGNAPSTIASDDLLWVEGDMRVQGDASLYGGKLSFLNPAGQDAGVPLCIQRMSKIDPSSLQTITSLQIEIGTSNQGNNMLSVGPLDSSQNPVPVLNVRDDGKVGVGTTTPRNPLGIRAAGDWEEILSFEDKSGNTKWHINQNPNGNNSGINFAETNVADFRLFIQAGGNIGIGTQSPTGRLTIAGIAQPAQGNLTFFSNTADVEYDGGSDQVFVFNAKSSAVTTFTGGKIGIGTSTPSNRLHVADANGIRQGRLYLSGDVGWSSVTYNAYHDVQGSAWTFPDSSHPATTIEMDDSGGRARFEVWTTTSASTTNWIQRFRVDGETGNIGINTGLVGIGGKLSIVSDVALQGKINFFSATSDMEYDGGSDGTFWFRGLNNCKTAFLGGNFGINASNPAAALDVVGDANVSGDVTAANYFYSSDLRLKRDVHPLEHALDKLLELRGVRFHWKDPEKHGGRTGPQIGLIAQEVEKVFPEWVKNGVDGHKVVGKTGFEALIIEAVRELTEEVRALAAQAKATRKRKEHKEHKEDDEGK